MYSMEVVTGHQQGNDKDGHAADLQDGLQETLLCYGG
jgi:hypothetical protein